MAQKSRPYKRFGPFLLFRKLESDPLSELWRAARIDGEALGPCYAVRRFTGGEREALRASVTHATPLLPGFGGTTTVRAQETGLAGDIPWIAWEYVAGRSLGHVIDQARGAPEIPANPIPIDQTLAICEKLAHALESAANLRYEGSRLTHGALCPQLVWVADDGDIRVGGHQMHAGLITSLSNPEVRKVYGGFFAPEIRETLEPTPASEVFSVGAVLYAMLTGTAPPDPLEPSAFDDTISRGALMVTGDPIPSEILGVLERSLRIDPADRFAGPAEIREAFLKLTHGDHYAPTTFNLAFYIHSLLRPEMEAEVAERDKEARVNVAAYVSPPGPRVADVPASFRSAADATAGEPSATPPRRTILIAATVGAVALAAAGGGYYMLSVRKEPLASPSGASATAPPTTKPAGVSQPLVTALSDTGGDPAQVIDEASSDDAARQKLIEDEINRRLQAEMMNLQAEHDRKLRDAESKRGAAPQPSAPPTPAARIAGKAQGEEAPMGAPQPAEEEAPAEIQQPTTPAPSKPLAQPVAAKPRPVAEGDLIGINDVDQPPRLESSTSPEYPALAAKQRAETTVIVSALISEAGRVIEVKVLRGDTRRLGFDEAAIKAVRSSVYSPALKNGKKVRVWMPVPVFFRLERR